MSKLNSLRDTLKSNNLDGFIVPRNDEYMGEYVAPHSERLAWLTGFNGSAGSAIALLSKGAIFVDGRYTLQAQHQVNQTDFEINELSRQHSYDWLSQHADEGAKIGYDPWLHPIEEIESLQKNVTSLKFVPVSKNPIDEVWVDQPAQPTEPVYLYPLHFSGKKSDDKLADLLKILTAKKADALLLTAPDSIAWLLNIRGSDVPHTPFALSFLLVHSSGKIDWFISPEKIDDIIKAELDEKITIHEPSHIKAQLKKLATFSLMVDPKTAPYWFYQVADEYNINLHRAADPVQLPKAIKNPVEIENNQKAHLYDGIAMSRFLCWLDTHVPTGDVTEISAAEQLLGFRKANNAFIGTSFDTISGAGSNAAIIHYRVTPDTNKHLRKDHIYLVDSGGQYFEGTTDITRTVFFGSASDEIKDRYTRVLKGHIALATAKFPKGTTGSQLDILARKALWDITQNYAHGTGHGVGCYLSVHEGPQRISPAPNAVALQPGMILSNEPGFYKEGEYGIRIENLVTVREDCEGWMSFQTLTLCPIALNMVDVSMLNELEKQWLNDYHAKVYDALHSHLNQQEQAWLKEATKAV